MKFTMILQSILLYICLSFYVTSISSSSISKLDYKTTRSDGLSRINFLTNPSKYTTYANDRMKQTKSDLEEIANFRRSSDLNAAGKSLLNIFLPCVDEIRPAACFKGRSEDLLDALDEGIPLSHSVSLVRQPGAVRLLESSGHPLSDKIMSFLASRSLLIKLPDFTLLFGQQTVQGRKKKDKGQGYLMMMMTMMAGWMISMKLAAVAAVAGKALAASMAALLMAAVAAIRRQYDDGHKHDYEVISVPSSHNHLHHRSYEMDRSNIPLTTTSHPSVYYYNYENNST